jgi:two-component system sensor histidine kinase HydH
VESILEKALGHEGGQAAAAEKRDLLARLLGRLAHEIRNPLSSLDIHVQLLEEDLVALAPQVRQQLRARLDIIQGELHRLESIVESFLRLTGPSAVDLERVEVIKLVTHVCELLRPEAGAREIEIVTRLAEGLPEVMVDPVRLTQALLNLVINAMQAMERKGRIEVSGSVAAETLTLSVRDTGPGIPPEKLASIFDPYFTTKSEGSGLGLWIAQQIVTAHGGTIQVQNCPQGGAVFTMALPLRRPA